jgi:hypothetical protein
VADTSAPENDVVQLNRLNLRQQKGGDDVSKLRWTQWYFADWSNDTALRLCSIPARGLWMDLLCIAAQGEPYGTVTIKGHIPTTAELFSLIAPRGTRRRDFDKWLAELEAHGVAQRDQTGAIRSPRLSQDGAISLARIEAATSSWKNKANSRNPRDFARPKDGNWADLHVQTVSFASHRTKTRITDLTDEGEHPLRPLKKEPPKSPTARGTFVVSLHPKKRNCH